MSEIVQGIAAVAGAVEGAAPATPPTAAMPPGAPSEIETRVAAIEAFIDKWEPILNALRVLVGEK